MKKDGVHRRLTYFPQKHCLIHSFHIIVVYRKNEEILLGGLDWTSYLFPQHLASIIYYKSVSLYSILVRMILYLGNNAIS